LPENSTIYVTIIPVNSIGEAQGCIEESFMTEDIISLPNCTNLQNPFDGQQNVAVNTNISWNPVSNTDGYIVTVGTSIGSTDILNGQNIGNQTDINLTENLPENTEIFVTIIPYNSDGEAINCFEESFITERVTQENPRFIIPKFFTPNNDSVNDFWLVLDPENQVQTISIFNRYGKLLKTLTNGQLFWDGTYNNQLQPVSDYWYSINFIDGKAIRGHFTLKR
jgi:gliding motility-associated-like protein